MLAALLLFACSPAPTAADAPARARTLTFAAFQTPREVYGKAILPAFAASWKERTGEVVTFQESYQASGAQARAVREGFEADVVALSLEPDVQLLEDAGLVAKTWRDAPNGGMVSRSIAVIAVREGNPERIADWDDLARPDVEVVTPNVRTSGGAMWNVLGVWGAAIRGHAGVERGDEAAALGLLTGVLSNVRVMDKGGRESIVTFEKGVGDAAITYEHEVLLARAEGRAITYVVPPSTVRIDNPAAVVETYAAKNGNLDLARALVAFLHGEAAQRAFAAHHYRPADPAYLPAGLPAPADLFTIDDLGGWGDVRAKVFAPGGVYDRAVAKPDTP